LCLRRWRTPSCSWTWRSTTWCEPEPATPTPSPSPTRLHTLPPGSKARTQQQQEDEEGDWCGGAANSSGRQWPASEEKKKCGHELTSVLDSLLDSLLLIFFVCISLTRLVISLHAPLAPLCIKHFFYSQAVLCWAVRPLRSLLTPLVYDDTRVMLSDTFGRTYVCVVNKTRFLTDDSFFVVCRGNNSLFWRQ
jgi:hypothetical protein